MIEFTPEAARLLDALREHYLEAERLEALHNLEKAIFEAIERIERAASWSRRATALPADCAPWPVVAEGRAILDRL